MAEIYTGSLAAVPARSNISPDNVVTLLHSLLVATEDTLRNFVPPLSSSSRYEQEFSVSCSVVVSSRSEEAIQSQSLFHS